MAKRRQLKEDVKSEDLTGVVVSYSKTYTLNLGDYESVKITVGVEAPASSCLEGKVPTSAIEKSVQHLVKATEGILQEELDAMED